MRLRRPRFAEFARTGALLAALAVGICAPASRAQADDGPEARACPVRVRVEWGSDNPQTWHGVVEAADGKLENPLSLGVEADEAGTLRIEEGALWLGRHSPRIYDGFDVTVIPAGKTRCTVTLKSSAADASPLRVAFDVNQIRDPDKEIRFEQGDVRGVMRRMPGDALDVHFDRQHLIFEPGESFLPLVRCDRWLLEESAGIGARLGVAAGAPRTRLAWELAVARSNSIISQGSQEISTETAAAGRALAQLNIPLPTEQGVYDVRLTLYVGTKTVCKSAVQVVVFAKHGTVDQADAESSTGQAAADDKPTLVDSFSPADAGFLRRVSHGGTVKRLGGTLNNLLHARPAGVPGDAAAGSGRIDFQAYKLKVRHPGRPHQLVVAANRETVRAIGVSLLEPNAAGQLMPIGLDSGLYVQQETTINGNLGSPADDDRQLIHRLLFWPKIKEPVLLLHDMGLGGALDVQTVSLYELDARPARPPQPMKAVDDGPAARTRVDTAEGRSPLGASVRLIGPYLHKPILPENFGATEAYDAVSRRSLDDWQTFLTAAERLADFLNRRGDNSLMLAVFADGSTLYPSSRLEPTPRYDTGVYFSTGQDPVRKDVLELVYRVFDRNGLVLVPQLQFSTPLPDLEREIAAGPKGRGIELIGSDGRSWRETFPGTRGQAPWYNPLDPRVQQSVIEVVRELAARSVTHSSFRALAVELSPTGYLQFPGLDWGYDDATVARFATATGTRIPAGNADDRCQRRYQFLTTQARDQWIAWRTSELAQFHRRIADAVRDVAPDAQLILSGSRGAGGSQTEDDLDETVRLGRKVETALMRAGLDLTKYADVKNLVLLRPSLWNAADNPLQSALSETVNDSPQLDALYSCCKRGSVFFHRPCECRIAEFDAQSSWQPAYTWLAAEAVPAGLINRKRFAHALAAGDALMIFDGGWTVPQGQDHYLARYRRIIGRLPAIDFHPAQAQKQPVVVRMAREKGKTWIYVVNQSGFPVDAGLNLSCPPDVLARQLDDLSPTRLIANSVRAPETAEPPTDAQVADTPPQPHSRVAFQLEPYDIWAAVIHDESTTVDDVSAVLGDASRAILAGRIEKLDQGIGQYAQRRDASESLLTNPGFELPHKETTGLPGWDVPAERTAHWALDADNPRSGQVSLMLAAGSQEPARLSSAVPLDGTRLLAISLWMRSDRDQADVRLVLDGAADGPQERKLADVKVDREWRQYRLQVAGLPHNRDTQARVRVEVNGPARVWIDDVDIRTQRLSAADMRQLTKVTSAITIAWNEGRYADCQRLLDSYWGQLLFVDEQAAPAQRNARPATTANRLERLLKR